jgi:hypothetical protein
MALLQELIEDSKYYVPSRVDRLLLRETILYEMKDGAAYDLHWLKYLIDLLPQLEQNIARHKPVALEDKKEQIMWRHHIVVMMWNALDAKKRTLSDRTLFLKIAQRACKVTLAILEGNPHKIPFQVSMLAYDGYKNLKSLSEFTKFLSEVLEKNHK